jgi:hypothetical protein
MEGDEDPREEYEAEEQQDAEAQQSSLEAEDQEKQMTDYQKQKRLPKATWNQRELLEIDVEEALQKVSRALNDSNASRVELKRYTTGLERAYDLLRQQLTVMPVDLRRRVDAGLQQIYDRLGPSPKSSKSSGRKSAVLQLKAKALRKEIEAKKAEWENQSEIARLEAELVQRRARAETMSLQRELRMTEQEMEELDDEQSIGYELEDLEERAPIPAHSLPAFVHPPAPVHLSPSPDDLEKKANLTDLVEQLSLSRVPCPEPEVFDGDPLKYTQWKASVHMLLNKRAIPSEEKVHYLKKYVRSSKESSSSVQLEPTKKHGSF